MRPNRSVASETPGNVMPHRQDSGPSVHIGVLYVKTLPEDLFSDFLADVEHEGLEVVSESYEQQVYGGIEWVLPTAAAVYISKAYFDGFLGEMGKDHYSLLKKGLSTLSGKLLGPVAPRPVVISSPGKTAKEQPYSLTYSIVAEAGGGYRFKLLFPNDLTGEEYEATLSGFLDFLAEFHARGLPDAIRQRFESTRAVGKTILLVYDLDLNDIRPIDPLAERQ
jgi:hypothetical protein